ncbi:MAG: malonyl-ACP O-methyltransferase BioC [Gammaproteobacteria bacterium]|nr:malonyl-ACP O-methyltransferase BioC [Gammaproteobacteria bacterium]
MFDKLKVRRSFDKAASTYDDSAILQREVVSRILERLDFIKLEPGVILDVGAGTGYIAQGLSVRYKKAKIIELDLSLAMLQQRNKHSPWYKRFLKSSRLVCGDAENLPVADNSVDMLFSSLTIQWCNDLQHTLKEFMRVLKPGGLLMFSTFGPDTLKELRDSWAKVDQAAHVSPFLDMHDIGDMLLHARLAEPVMDVETFTLTYDNVTSLVNDLRAIGATNASHERQKGLTAKSDYRAMLAAYESWRDADNKIPASYEVIYGHAWKGQLAEDAGNVQVEFHR